MRIPSISAVACLSLLPLVSAFYPYVPVYPKINSRKDLYESIRHAEDALNPRDDSISLSIRRTLTRRTNKYNIISAQPPTQSNSVAVDQDGTDFSYMVTVTFGTSSEEYYMLLDSAASNTWVMGGDCTSDVCNAHNTFGNGDSTSLTVSNICSNARVVMWDFDFAGMSLSALLKLVLRPLVVFPHEYAMNASLYFISTSLRVFLPLEH